MKKTHDPTRSATLDLLKKIEKEMYYPPPLADRFLDVVEKCCRQKFKRSSFPGPRAAGANVAWSTPTITGIEAMLKKLEDETK